MDIGRQLRTAVAMMLAMSPLRLIVDDWRETWFVLLGAGVDELSSSRPNVKYAPDATSAPHRPPTSAPIRNWRSRLGRSGEGGGGPGGAGDGGTVGGSAGHAGGGGTVTTSAGGGASSGTVCLQGREFEHRHLKRRPIRRRFLKPLSCCSHLRHRMMPPNSGNRNVSGAV